MFDAHTRHGVAAGLLADASTQLAPTLSKGDVVIMDNLSSHKGMRITELLQDCGAWPLFLPLSI
jgi:transposase